MESPGTDPYAILNKGFDKKKEIETNKKGFGKSRFRAKVKAGCGVCPGDF